MPRATRAGPGAAGLRRAGGVGVLDVARERIGRAGFVCGCMAQKVDDVTNRSEADPFDITNLAIGISKAWKLNFLAQFPSSHDDCEATILQKTCSGFKGSKRQKFSAGTIVKRMCDRASAVSNVEQERAVTAACFDQLCIGSGKSCRTTGIL